MTSIDTGASVRASVSSGASIQAKITDGAALSASVGTVLYRDPNPYTGEYVSIPSSREQIYETRSRTMLDDFTVREIPVYRADNQDGITVTIAES